MSYDFCAIPNKDSYSESIKFRSAIFRAINGYQETKSLLTIPKFVCKYSALVFNTNKHRMFLNGFRDGLTYKVLHPLWGKSTTATQATTGTTIYCETSYSEFEVGSKVFLVKSYEDYDVVGVTEVYSDRIVVDSSVDVVVGRIILPSFYGIITGNINTNYTTERFSECSIVIEELV